MPEPRVSVLIVAKNEAHNLADCLAAASWAFERDRRRRPGQSRRDPGNRPAEGGRRRRADFDDFASQRNFALALASGDWVLSVDADERVTPALADEIRRVIADPANPYRGFRVPIRSVILGRAVRLFRDAARPSPAPVPPRFRPLDRPGSRDRRARRSRRIACKTHSGIIRCPMCRFFSHKLDHYTTLEAQGLAGSQRRFRTSDLALRPIWTFFKLYVFKQGFRDGAGRLHVLCSFRRFGGGAGLEAPRADPGGEDVMIAEHEAVVASRFDALHGRFKRDAGRRTIPGCAASSTVSARSPAAASSIWAAARAGLPGRSSSWGRRSSGSTCRRRCWMRRQASIGSAPRPGGCRSARRVLTRSWPSRSLNTWRRDRSTDVCGEVRRVLRPGGHAGHRRQERLLVERPAALAAERGREVDRRAPRPLDVFPSRESARALVQGQGSCKSGCGGGFRRSASNTCCRGPSRAGFRFSTLPGTRLFVLVGRPGAGRRRVTELYSPMLASLPLLLWKTPPGLELILAQEGVAFETVNDPHPFSFRGGRFVLYDGRVVSPGSLRGLVGPDHVAIDIDGLRRGEPVDPFEALVDNKPAHRLVAGRPVDAVRAGGAIAQGVDSPAVDRQIARGRHRPRGASGSGWPPFRTRIARPSASVPTSMSPVPTITIASPRPVRPWTGVALIFSAPTPIPTIRRSSPTCGSTTRSRTGISITSIASPRPIGSTWNAPTGFSGARDSSRWPSRPRTAAGGSSLDDQLEDLGYLYSSEFQLGHDDFPFYPWKGNRFSRILQIPVHPVCEGLFLEAGVDDPGDHRRLFPAGRGAPSSMPASSPSSMAIPSAGWGGCPRS